MADVQESFELGDVPLTAVLSDGAAGALVLDVRDAAGADLLSVSMTPGPAEDPDAAWLAPWTFEIRRAGAVAASGQAGPADPPLSADLAPALPARVVVDPTGFGADVQIYEGDDLAGTVSAERLPDGNLHLYVDPGDLVSCD